MPAATRNLTYLALLWAAASWPTCGWTQDPPAESSSAAGVETVRADGNQAAHHTATTPSAPEVLRDYLVIPQVGQYGRRLVALDPIEAALVSGDWRAPSAGDHPAGGDDQSASWRPANADSDGWLNTRAAIGGYAYASYTSEREQVLILHAERHAAVAVNGHWYTGDPYGHGWLRLPVKLKKGRNELLFHLAGPRLRATLTRAPGPAYLAPRNATLPDLLADDDAEVWAGIPVINATDAVLRGAKLVTQVDAGPATVTSLPPIPALCVYKAATLLSPPAEGAAGECALTVKLLLPDGQREVEQAEATLALRRVTSSQPRTCTFVSRIDGGVQPYRLAPASTPEDPQRTPGIILALHNAGEGIATHADAYAPRPWAHVVAPYNRGEAGFDWEDWGRVDALEALTDAQLRVPNDPSRVYATGYGMGAHGAWRLGMLHPDLFAAVGPNAGWVSHWTYGGGMPTYENPTEVQQVLLRAAAVSDTAKLAGNLQPVGVYVLHGLRDPIGVSQSRYMRQRLGEFHADFVYHERPQAALPGSDACCDWAPMMEFFRQRTSKPSQQVDRVAFATPDLSVASGPHWARIEMQQRQGELSRVDIRLRSQSSRFRGTTDNVRRLSLDTAFLPKNRPVRIQLDGGPTVTAKPDAEGRVYLSRGRRNHWAQAPPPPGSKHPGRSGGFKRVFDRRVVLVYGTAGNRAENAWAQAKARYDAQCFWYRGNGALQVLPDVEFDASGEVDRNVVLYGNAETNRAWPGLLSTCPVQVRGNRVSVSSKGVVRPESGDGLGVLFVYPRAASNTALVGVVGGTGLRGMRATNRVRYFYSGVHLPDLLILGHETALLGDADVRAAGYFGFDWRVRSGEIVWRDTAL